MKKLISAAVAVLFLSVGIINAQTDPAKAASTQTEKKTTTSASTKKVEPKCDMKNCCMMKDNKMVCMKDGKEMPMTKETTCANGSKCMPDGTCIAKDGTKTKMKNGDCCDSNGKMCKMDEPKRAAPKQEEKTDPAK